MLLIQVLSITVTALAGQLSNVQNRRLQFDLAKRFEHRRMILGTIDKINKMPVWRRLTAMRQLQAVVRHLQREYNVADGVIETKETHRRHRFTRYHQ